MIRRAKPSTAASVQPAVDDQVEQMVADPASYFARSRQEARAEARRYVASHEGRLRTA